MIRQMGPFEGRYAEYYGGGVWDRCAMALRFECTYYFNSSHSLNPRATPASAARPGRPGRARATSRSAPAGRATAPILADVGGARQIRRLDSQHWRWKIEVRDSLVSFGAHGLRVRARRADHAERIHFFHRFREQGAFCRNSLFLFMSQKACRSVVRSH